MGRLGRARLALAGLVLGACGQDTVGTLPEARGELAEYFPLRPGTSYLYRRDGDPQQTSTLSVRSAEGGVMELELVPSDPEAVRIAMLVRVGLNRVEVLRLDRGAVRIELEQPLTALVFPLLEGVAFSGTTSLELLGARLGVNLLGVTEDVGEAEVLDRTYGRSFFVDVTVQTDLLGRTRVELILAPDLGPVQVKVVSPAVEQLGLDGVELRLELLERTGGTLP
jgi:hypothetical protein